MPTNLTAQSPYCKSETLYGDQIANPLNLGKDVDGAYVNATLTIPKPKSCYSNWIIGLYTYLRTLNSVFVKSSFEQAGIN